MSLSSVIISEEVWLTCTTHALTTASEEIMGLLFGDVKYLKGGKTALIWGVSPQIRSDRRKDRVETNPEQLSAAIAEADRMTLITGNKTRVIGWYHSHPGHTVIPSNVVLQKGRMIGSMGVVSPVSMVGGKSVCLNLFYIYGVEYPVSFPALGGDLIQPNIPHTFEILLMVALKCVLVGITKGYETDRGEIQIFPKEKDVTTQGSFQALDSGFIGLIFSCFNEFAHKVGRIEVIAFQSLKETQMHLAPVNNTQVIENHATSACGVSESFEHGTGDSRATEGKQKMQVLSIVPNNADSLQDATLDIDSMDTVEGLQEALHRSTMDMSGGIWVRKVVPLQVLPTKDLLKLDYPLDSLLDMQNMLFEEERLAFKNAIAENSCDGKIDPVTYIHHVSTYQASLCNMMEYCLGPAINALEDNLKENEVRLAKLVEEGKALDQELTRKEMESLSVHS